MVTIREKTTVTTRISGAGVSHARCDIASRDVRFQIDEPLERGGTNTGPSPTETGMAALVGCTNVIAHKCAHKLGIDIGHLTIDMACEFDRRGVLLQEEIEVPFIRIRLKIAADGPATADELAQVAAEVAKYCPLAKLFRAAGTIIEEEWIPRS